MRRENGAKIDSNLVVSCLGVGIVGSRIFRNFDHLGKKEGEILTQILTTNTRYFRFKITLIFI